MLIDNMKLLVVLALVTVAVCLTEGLLVSKCDLRDYLMKATALRLPPKAQHHMTNEDFVAKSEYHLFIISHRAMHFLQSI